MHPRIAEVLNYVDEQRGALRDAVELVPPELREKQARPDRWSVAQVLHHLAGIETRVGRGVTKWVTDARDGGLGPEMETSSVLGTLDLPLIADRTTRKTAPEDFTPPSDVDAETAWAALERSREALRAGLRSGDGLALSEVIQPHPVLGPINIYQWVLFVGGHEARHTAQVREIAAEFNAASKSTAGSI